MNEKRADRLSSIVQKAISDIIQFKVKSDKVGFVTVTAAEVTRDLSYCYVYVSILNDKNHEKFEALKPRYEAVIDLDKPYYSVTMKTPYQNKMMKEKKKRKDNRNI